MTCRSASLVLALALSSWAPSRAWGAEAAAAKADTRSGLDSAKSSPRSPAAEKDKSADKAKEKARDKDSDREGSASEPRPRSARLEDRIPPVSGNLFRKQGRFEITPSVGLSLADAFFQKYLFGLKLGYHAFETFSLGVFGYYALDTAGRAVTVCKTGGCAQPTMEDLTSVPGKLGLLAGAEVGWTPIYGKVNLFAEKVLHFDTGLVGGVSLIQYAEPLGAMTMTAGGHLGVAQRYFLTPSLTVRLELRDYLYSAHIVRLGDTTSKLENQLVLELGLSFFAGESPKD